MEQMPDVIKGFTHTEYLTVFSAIIFGYVGSEYFQGWGTLIRNRRIIKVYWHHIFWTIFSFLLFIQNWWGIWPRIAYINESIFYFMYSLVPIFIFHLISVVLFPDFSKRSKLDMKDYFYQNTRWLFSIFTIYFIITITSSFVYPDIGDVTVQNIIRSAGIALSVSAAYFHKNKVLHLIFLIIGFLALIRFFQALP